MKKVLLLMCALLAVSLLSAQELTKPWWGMRGGVNFSNLSSIDYSTQYLTGYSFGVTYSHPLATTLPLFLESGIYFALRGARDNGFLTESGHSSLLRRHEFEVPLLIGCQIPLTSPWSVQPFVGFYYSVAINGEFKIGAVQFEPFKKEMLQTLRDKQPKSQKLLHRSDFGMRIGVSALCRSYLFGFFYDAGFLNLYSRSLRDAGYQAQSGCFTIQIGRNF